MKTTKKPRSLLISRSKFGEYTVLPPGSYVIKRLDSPSDYHTVQIFSAGEKHLITTISLQFQFYRNEPMDNSRFEFYESTAGQTASLHTWFLPLATPLVSSFRAGEHNWTNDPRELIQMPWR